MKQIEFTVQGDPAPQGSKRHVGNGIMVESASATLKPWRAAIAAAAAEAGDGYCFTGPVRLTAVYYLRRPAGHYGTGRNFTVVRPGAPAYPHRKPDLDKLQRAFLDALTTSGIIRDDAQIVDFGDSRKEYAQAGQSTGAYARLTGLAETYGELLH